MVIVYRVPVVDGVVQDGPKTYFEKYTAAGIPYFVKEMRQAKRFQDYRDDDYCILERALRSTRNYDWAPLEVER